MRMRYKHDTRTLVSAATEGCDSDRRGMTIVEVLVALVLLAVFFAAAAQLVTSSRRSADMAREYQQAVGMADDRIERIKTFDYDQLLLIAEDNVRVDEYGDANPEGQFLRNTEVVTFTNGLCREVSVTVQVLNRKSRRFDTPGVTLRTLVANLQTEE